MMAGPGAQDAGGGPARHIPVLLAEVLEALSPLEGRLIVDGTFGAGGYSRAMLEAGASVVGIDRDPDAVAAGRQLEQAFKGRLRLVHGAFSALD
jgi:16S rRNA (cytosine1402-N4)-methyltransferase